MSNEPKRPATLEAAKQAVRASMQRWYIDGTEPFIAATQSDQLQHCGCGWFPDQQALSGQSFRYCAYHQQVAMGMQDRSAYIGEPIPQLAVDMAESDLDAQLASILSEPDTMAEMIRRIKALFGVGE